MAPANPKKRASKKPIDFSKIRDYRAVKKEEEIKPKRRKLAAPPLLETSTSMVVLSEPIPGTIVPYHSEKPIFMVIPKPEGSTDIVNFNSMVISKPEGSTDIVNFKNEPQTKTYRCGYHGLINLCKRLEKDPAKRKKRDEEKQPLNRYFWAQQKRSYSGSRTNSWRMNSTDWPQLIHENLMSSIRNQKAGPLSVHGCVMHLLLSKSPIEEGWSEEERRLTLESVIPDTGDMSPDRTIKLLKNQLIISQQVLAKRDEAYSDLQSKESFYYDFVEFVLSKEQGLESLKSRGHRIPEDKYRSDLYEIFNRMKETFNALLEADSDTENQDFEEDATKKKPRGHKLPSLDGNKLLHKMNEEDK
ncbi:hypothetical protein MKW98_026891 [Papaver atlanticum]|uniref:Uncharacterized protein n=1 Tax=Papaver atlanticum TaxID=357466 RepID=A0AAD4SVR8_9MAGN|nr:hypothetical protein MKW98_026891 [Papaver atlanticum]